MPTVLITPEAMRDAAEPYVDILHEAGFEIRYPDNPLLARGLGTDQETIEELTDVDATIASSESYTPGVLAARPRLKVIARSGVGYDRVDVEAATNHNVVLTITPNANHEAVAELTLALLFACTKRLVSNDKMIRQGKWPRAPLHPIRGKTLGIVGLGRIGRSTAIRASAMRMNVIATESFPDQAFVAEHQIQLVDFDTLLAQSDFVSVHCPLNNETAGLFDCSAFAKMKPDSVFINAARGGLVVEPDLVEALRSGPLRAAGLDVFAEEPPDPDSPLFELDNVVLSPHIAGADEESAVGMGVEAATNIVKLYQGQWPEGAVVNDSLRDGWRWD